jgi:sulfur carrier protein
VSARFIDAASDQQDAPVATVRILLDDLPHEVAAGTTLGDLVAALGHVDDAVATAVNTRFVARGLRCEHILQAGDTVLLFQPIVGG